MRNRDGRQMSREDAMRLLARAEKKYHLKIFENICEKAVRELPLRDRMGVVGRAVMERCDCDGYVLGLKLLKAADALEPEC